MRDLAFADLLPGTTMVIFVCNDCMDEGEWVNCSSIVWLPKESSIHLQEQGAPQPLRQLAAWYGADTMGACDLPENIVCQMPWENDSPTLPCQVLPASHGTKAGGVPAYLQPTQVFFDREGYAMEYIAQISTPDHISSEGFGYVYHSTLTGETCIEFQNT
jgi:hypothetical protein